jgi:hypothetical protein
VAGAVGAGAEPAASYGNQRRTKARTAPRSASRASTEFSSRISSKVLMIYEFVFITKRQLNTKDTEAAKVVFQGATLYR